MFNFVKQEEHDFQRFLQTNKFHPLNFMQISEIKLIGKTKEYKLYEFFNEDQEKFQTLKVMTDLKLYTLEKEILAKIDHRRVSVNMLNDFTYEQKNCLPLKENFA